MHCKALKIHGMIPPLAMEYLGDTHFIHVKVQINCLKASRKKGKQVSLP